MFQAASDSSTTSNADFTSGGDSIKDLANLSNINLVKAQNLLSEFSGDILAVFTQTRERVYELQTSIVDAIPGVQRLGGGIKDVSDTIGGVALASRRNVVASKKDIEELFAASKILGDTVEKISNSFLDVGVGISNIPKEIQKSIEYVQSIGGNAKSVMKDVTENMGQMNRFQFEDGVRGLTKMAAQASMLRFSMKETFTLADRVLTPDGAIKTAAAFQRLGLAVGGLGDPLQLMNQALNDPSGLQDSLVEVAKKFTYFDNKTKSFKINPEGVLTLRALADQTGVSAEEMTKLGLAAQDLDRRLSSISPSINIKEDDKQYLANIARMTEGGEYVVKLEGSDEDKKLSEITQKEFDKLIELQKKEPKTLEDTAKAQLSNTELIKNDLRAIRSVIAGGVVTADKVQTLNETARKITTELMGNVLKDFDVKSVRTNVNKLLDQPGKIERLISSGEFDSESIMKNLFPQEEIAELGKETIGAINDKAGLIGIKLKEAYYKMMTPTSSTSSTTTSTAGTSRMTTTGISAYGPQSAASNPILNRPTTNQTDVRFENPLSLDLNFKNAPSNLTQDEMNQIIEQSIKKFKMAINESAFKHYVVAVNDYENNRGSRSSPTYP